MCPSPPHCRCKDCPHSHDVYCPSTSGKVRNIWLHAHLGSSRCRRHILGPSCHHPQDPLQFSPFRASPHCIFWDWKCGIVSILLWCLDICNTEQLSTLQYTQSMCNSCTSSCNKCALALDVYQLGPSQTFLLIFVCAKSIFTFQSFALMIAYASLWERKLDHDCRS